MDDSTRSGTMADALFRQVATDFRASLRAKERSTFREFENPSLMISQLQSELNAFKEKSRLLKLSQKIERFAEAWSPYFEITGIFVSSNPEFSALAWGAVRLVFLLGTNYVTFLEKIATMFESIGNRLPGYHEYHARVLNRWTKIAASETQLDAYHIRRRRTFKAIAYVYADIVQFCQEACKIFSAKKHGVRYSAGVIGDILWRPFDQRFAALLERMKEHSALFTMEMNFEESIFLELQLKRAQEDAKLTQDALKDLRNQIEKSSESNRLREAEISESLAKLDKLFETFERWHELHPEEPEPEEGALVMRVQEFKKWVCAPDYTRTPENAKSKRQPGTCEWFIKSQEYISWKSCWQNITDSSTSDSPSQPQPPILVVRGKPGYGKTVLSTLIVDELSTPSVAIDHFTERECVLFYHFASIDGQDHDPSHAFRAFLTQLIHIYRCRKSFIDTVSILHDTSSTGQLVASDGEVTECLALLLSHTSRTSILIDGIDECTDPKTLLEQAHGMCMQTSTPLILLGRTNIEIPAVFASFTSFDLSRAHNCQDIRQYLEPAIQNIQDRDLLPAESDVDKILTALVDKSLGMFLWATLMVRYLECPALSPDEREEAIFKAGLVEGIEGLYCAILNSLSKNYKIQLDKARRVFNLVAVAKRPFTVTEMQILLAMTPGRKTSKGRFIRNPVENIPIICGALVEVQAKKSVHFIHASFREFLLEAHRFSVDRVFQLDQSEAHFSAAISCLSSLLYDAPLRPLMDTSSTVSEAFKHSLRELFPLLEYSIYWVKHAAEGDKLLCAGNDAASRKSKIELLGLMSCFLSQKIRIGTWVEISYIFAQPPNVDCLINLVTEIPDSTHGRVCQPSRNISLQLREFIRDIARLREYWDKYLLALPGVIWDSCVTAFLKSDFLPEPSSFKVSSFSQADAGQGLDLPGPSDSIPQEILAFSQVSDSGDSLGIVWIVPSKKYRNSVMRLLRAALFPDIRISRSAHSEGPCIYELSSGWAVKYQQRCVQTDLLTLEAHYDIPTEDIQDLLSRSLESTTPERLQLPIAASKDLQRFVVFGTILTLVPRDVSSEIQQSTFRSQRCCRLFRDYQEGPTAQYSPVISPSGLAFAYEIGEPNGKWEVKRVNIWAQDIGSNYDSEFDYAGYVESCRINLGSRSSSSMAHCFDFHPTLPAIVYTDSRHILGWCFSRSSSSCKQLVLYENPVFPVDVRFKFGSEAENGWDQLEYLQWKPLNMINESATRSPPTHISDNYCSVPDAAHNEFCRHEFTTDKLRTYFPGKSKDSPTLQVVTRSVNVIDELEDNAYPGSQLEQLVDARHTKTGKLHLVRDRSTNAIYLHGRVSTPGSSEALVHLPDIPNSHQTSVSLALPAPDDEWTRVIWNQCRQNSYSLLDPVNPFIPCIISKRHTAPQNQGSIEKRLSSTAEEDFEEPPVVRRRLY